MYCLGNIRTGHILHDDDVEEQITLIVSVDFEQHRFFLQNIEDSFQSFSLSCDDNTNDTAGCKILGKKHFPVFRVISSCSGTQQQAIDQLDSRGRGQWRMATLHVWGSG